MENEQWRRDDDVMMTTTTTMTESNLWWHWPWTAIYDDIDHELHAVYQAIRIMAKRLDKRETAEVNMEKYYQVYIFETAFWL